MNTPLHLFLLFFLCLLSPLTVSSQHQLGQDILGDAPNDFMGWSVALSADGRRMAVGSEFSDAAGQDAGQVRMYEWVQGAWEPLGQAIQGAGPSYLLGSSASFSSDGNSIAIGSFGGRANGVQSGEVRIFDWDDSTWVQRGGAIVGESPRMGIGYDVALSADALRVIVSGPIHGGVALESGIARVYEWQGGAWVQLGGDIHGIDDFDNMGWSVAISGDGRRVASGAPSYNGPGVGADVGLLRVMEWNGFGWANVGPDIKGQNAGELLGYSVALSEKGDTMVVGLPGAANTPFGRAGRARVYVWKGNQWQQLGQDIVGTTYQVLMGIAVDISSDGKKIAVGAEGANNYQGEASVYEWNGCEWDQVGDFLRGNQLDDRLGRSLSLSDNGNVLVAGAHYNSQAGSKAGLARAYYVSEELRKGKVIFDENSNCQGDSGEKGLPNATIWFTKKWEKVIAHTDDTGAFEVWLDTGTYTVFLDSLSHPYHMACPSSQQVEIINNEKDPPSINFHLQPLVNCPNLSIAMSSSGIARCTGGSYEVSYCNHGTQVEDQPLIKIELDSDLTFASASIQPSSIQGQTIWFDGDSLEVGACQQFTVNFTENCQANPGDIHCSKAHIFPDSVCSDNVNVVRINQSCQGDRIRYDLEDLGEGLPNNLPYQIFKENKVVSSGNIQFANQNTAFLDQLTFGDSATFQLVLSPNDYTYFTSTPPISCPTQGKVREMSFLPHTKVLAEDIDCQKNHDKLLRNEKSSIPIGNGPNKEIFPATPIEYTIRFQNKGNDAVHRVRILDTLTKHLDPFTFTHLGSSHPCKVTLLKSVMSEVNLVEYIFDPIALPDSATNPQGSNGFVKFLIRPFEGTQAGRVIENRASIYFDSEKPVQTNSLVHIFASPTIAVVNEPVSFPQKTFAFPNPTKGKLHIKGENVEVVELFDLSGRLVFEQRLAQKVIDLSNLPKGRYWLQISAEKEVSGQIIVIE